MPKRGAFLLRIQKSRIFQGHSTEPMNILIRRPYLHLAENLRKVYKDQDPVNIIVDRRYGERRKKSMPVVSDGRIADRRNQKERIWQMNLIVKRAFSYLTDDFQRVFKGQEDVNIIVDSRHENNDRRINDMPISQERRRSDRRRSSETLVDVVISY